MGPEREVSDTKTKGKPRIITGTIKEEKIKIREIVVKQGEVEETTLEKGAALIEVTIQTEETSTGVTRITMIKGTSKMIDSKTEVAQIDLEDTKTEAARTKIEPAEESTPWE